MKTFYRLLNQHELPRVGDEALEIMALKWITITEESLPDFEKWFELQYIIRRELHPQEMAKECAKSINQHFFLTSKVMVPPDLSIEALILPHIQAALEGKG